jgi:predicted NAD/FAD-dependent oxidoreductase/deoxyribodipyrimidine photolyase
MATLPAHLDERCRWISDLREPRNEGPVIVWLKSTFRVNENPALDVGRTLAAHHNRPLLVYHGLDERYPHASLRHHNSVLDAAVDMHDGCNALGLRYVLHVAREGHRQPVMRALAEMASVVVTDMIPLPPWSSWVKTIASMNEAPVVEVDGHCVVPMPLFGRSVDRPFRYRDATKKLRKRRLQARWPECQVKAEPYLGPLPFDPVDIPSQVRNREGRWKLMASCNIDPTVHPVWAERGGEKAALARWQAFLIKGLNGYARRRNNAADASGVSRLSSAFHYGTLSPMRVAREAAEVGTKSADKYLDELLVFREHAWHHAFAVDDPAAYHHLPTWAKDSWEGTQNDPRPVQLTREQLDHSEAPDRLWNLCQTSLRHHGELHNNVRMTWGKAFPQWTPDAQTSLAWAQHLNDKYALDGRDASSVVGVQWCHGLFDRPFLPGVPIMGVVRQRDPRTHASRLDLTTFEDQVLRPVIDTQHPVIVVGAGYAGAMAAQCLKAHGVDVLVIDKGRRAGGRASARPLGRETLSHGTTFLDDLPSWFEDTLAHMRKEGRVDLTEDSVHLRQGPVVVEHLLRGIDVLTGITLSSMEPTEEGWLLHSTDGEAWIAGGVVLTAPLPQAARLLGEKAPKDWSTSIYDPIWSTLLHGESPVPAGVLAAAESADLTARLGDGEPAHSVVLHAKSEWSSVHLEDDRTSVAQRLLDACCEYADAASISWLRSASASGHRWRYGRANRAASPLDLPRMVMAGDAWSTSLGTVGGALSSGAWAAARLMWEQGDGVGPKTVALQQTLF